MIRIKRVYELPSPEDGLRILVDRLWPRGLKRETAAIDKWAKDIAPSHGLRKWFGHEPSRWQEFQARYRTELQGPVASSVIEDLCRMASEGGITLVYASTEMHLNNAEAFRGILMSSMPGAEQYSFASNHR